MIGKFGAFLLLLLLFFVSAIKAQGMSSPEEEQDAQESCPSVESLTRLLQDDYEVFIGSRRRGITEEQLTELEARFNETIVRAAVYNSLFDRLFRSLNAAVQRELFHQLTASLSQDWDARINETVALAINSTQENFFQSYSQLFNDLNATLRSNFDTLALANSITQENFFQSYSQLFNDLNATLRSDFNTLALANNITQESFFQSYSQLFNDLNATLRSDFNTLASANSITQESQLVELEERLNTTVASLYDELFHNLEAVLRATDIPSPPGSVCCGQCCGWRRIANLDMTNSSHSCPPAWRQITSPKRTCARSTDTRGCDSAVFPSNGYRYSQVCGRIKAYQCGSTDAFRSSSSDIYSNYVDGVSVTHGSPRQHIWTFAAGFYELYSGSAACPCSSHYSGSIPIPSFVGNDYFCDTGADTRPRSCQLDTGAGFLTSDPLWDGAGCASTSSCCEFNNPPWFCKTLPQPTSDNIEVRLCSTYRIEDTPIELIEIYVN